MSSQKNPVISKRQLELEKERFAQQKFAIVVDGAVTLGRTFLVVAGWVGIFGFLYLSIRVLAGKETTFHTILEATARASADRYALLIASLFSGGMWYRERKLKEKIIKEHAPILKDYELRFDPNRTSSKLAETGEARKEDKNVN